MVAALHLAAATAAETSSNICPHTAIPEGIPLHRSPGLPFLVPALGASPSQSTRESQGHMRTAKRCRQPETLLHSPSQPPTSPASLQRCPKPLCSLQQGVTALGDSGLGHPGELITPLICKASSTGDPPIPRLTMTRSQQQLKQNPRGARQVCGTGGGGGRRARAHAVPQHSLARRHGLTECPWVP